MSNMNLKEISRNISTPAYVFSGAEFAERAEAVRDILGKDIGLCYSMKANPFLLEVLPDVFRAVEVCSPGELEICIRRNIPGERIIYSGLNKGADDTARAVSYGAGIITAESRKHLELISRASAEAGTVSKVLVRISADSQFGIDRREAQEILKNHEAYPAIQFAGLHFFTGTQKRKPKEIVRELTFLGSYLEETRELSGLELEKVEYGTGLPAYLFIDKEINGLSDAEEKELGFLREIAPSLRELAEKCELTIEMGRFFAASCGHYFTRTVDMKVNDGTGYAIIDGGSHQIRYYGQMQGMQIPFIDHISENGTDSPDTQVGEALKWTVCGSLCTTADVLARNAEFRDLKEGDVLVFHKAGAYSLYECMSLFLSRDLPRIYLHDGEKLIMCRDRMETNGLNTVI
jgi:diaminopimelate decarboxylase